MPIFPTQNFSDPSAESDERPNTLIEKLLDMEEIDINLYRSKSLWLPLGARGVFGGQVVGQALAAAIQTVPENFVVHSLHSYFLLPGDSQVPILYDVDRLRDGRSFATRSVIAKQKGRAIFTMTLSFQIPAPNSVSHQYPMPDVPHHSELRSQEELMLAMVDNPDTPEQYAKVIKMRMEEPVAMDFKDTHRHAMSDITNAPKRTTQAIWLRAKGNLGDNLAFHQCVLAYSSDHNLIGTVALAHGATWFSRRTTAKVRMMASLDHTIWFHQPFRADEWLLYVFETPQSGNGRGLALGRVYKEDGTLVASVAQEGVVRIDPPESAKESKL